MIQTTIPEEVLSEVALARQEGRRPNLREDGLRDMDGGVLQINGLPSGQAITTLHHGRVARTHR